jgi:tripartite ATP-independent transporter DctM subunit
MLSLLMTGLFIALMLARVPVAIAIGLAALPPLLILDKDLAIIPQYMLDGVTSTPLLAVPLFILAGNLFGALGLSRRIWDFARHVVGHFRGGLGHVMVIANVIFAGISGSALADAAALGLIGIPEMERHGYRRRFAAAITLCSSVIGPMFPPSINLILYGIVAQVSIGRLFLGGVVPGLIIALAMMGFIWLIAVSGREPCPVAPRSTLRGASCGFVRAAPALAVPVIVILGMGFGLITPTEVGVLAVLYAGLLGLIYREASPRRVYRVVDGAAKATVNIMLIIATSSVAGWIYAYDGTSQRVAAWMFAITQDKTLLLLMINLFLLIMGCMLEPIPLLILTVPIFLPLIGQLGVDPVHFGIIMSLNITIGIVHPPIGIGLYVIMGIVEIRFEDLVWACLPLIVPLLACLMLFTYVPELTLWLPNLIMGGP